MQKEIWKDVPGYEGYYQASSLGNIRSLDRLDNMGRKRKGTILSQRLGSNGYYSVILCNNGVRGKLETHQIIAITYLNHTPCGYNIVVDHINHDRLNNKVSNLRLISTRENVSNSVKNPDSGYTGVFKGNNKWRARIYVNRKYIGLGTFNTEDEASEYYQNALICINEDRINDIKIKKPKFSSKYKYVGYHSRDKKWNSYIIINKKQKYLGYFNTEEEAHQAVLKYKAE